MRLAAQAKMGYYPTPEDVTPIIAKYLKRRRKVLIRILDPCAGNGTTLKHVGDVLHGVQEALNGMPNRNSKIGPGDQVKEERIGVHKDYHELAFALYQTN